MYIILLQIQGRTRTMTLKERQADIWRYHQRDYICIPTNGFVKGNGRCVMGRGLAKQCVQRIQNIDLFLGEMIKRHGNVPIIFKSFKIISFPVKHHWKDRADLVLIRQSAVKLVTIADKHDLKRVVLPRVGCGNGKRKWEEVRGVIEDIFENDERFLFVTLSNLT